MHFLGQKNLSDKELLTKEDLEYRIEYLNNLDKKYSDLGPVYDCVVFFDGEVWTACIDTSEEGNLENGVLLREYSKTYDYSPLTKADQLNISINIHENGNVLEIVGLCCACHFKYSCQIRKHRDARTCSLFQPVMELMLPQLHRRTSRIIQKRMALHPELRLYR